MSKKIKSSKGKGFKYGATAFPKTTASSLKGLFKGKKIKGR
jgi:hypothetical protein